MSRADDLMKKVNETSAGYPMSFSSGGEGTKLGVDRANYSSVPYADEPDDSDDLGTRIGGEDDQDDFSLDSEGDDDIDLSQY